MSPSRPEMALTTPQTAPNEVTNSKCKTSNSLLETNFQHIVWPLPSHFRHFSSPPCIPTAIKHVICCAADAPPGIVPLAADAGSPASVAGLSIKIRSGVIPVAEWLGCLHRMRVARAQVQARDDINVVFQGLYNKHDTFLPSNICTVYTIQLYFIAEGPEHQALVSFLLLSVLYLSTPILLRAHIFRTRLIADTQNHPATTRHNTATRQPPLTLGTVVPTTLNGAQNPKPLHLRLSKPLH